MKPAWSWYHRLPVVVEWVVAILFVAAAAIITAQLRHMFPATPNSLFFCAIIVSAWIGGWGPGFLASILASTAIIFWLPPPASINPTVAGEVPRFLVFLLASVFISSVCSRQKRAEAALRQARDELDQRVQERTRELSVANEELRTEIAGRKRTGALLDGQRQVLEMMATDAPLPESLAALMRLIEAQVPGMLGSILLIDEQGVHLRHGAAPSLPPEYMKAIDGVAIGPYVGSCGTAAHLKEPVMVGDITSDPRWEKYRALALAHGLRACWSTPIFTAQRRLLGTFAMYYRQPALPEPEHLRLIEMATHIAAIAICRDRAQAMLRESEAKFKEAQRIANLGYWDIDPVADQITWSEETWRIFGLQPQNRTLSQAELLEMIHPADRSIRKQAMAEALKGLRPYDAEYRIVRPNGEVRFVHFRDEIVYDKSGRPIRLFGTVQDTTERKQAEELLKAREQEIRAIVENSPDFIVRYDRELRRTYVNPAFIKASGLPREALLGREIGSAAKDGAVNATLEEIEILESSLKSVLAAGRPFQFESTWPLPTGRRSFSVHLEPEFDAQGALTSILGISRDVTEQKRAEEAVRDSQQLLHLVLATLPVGVAVTDRSGDIILTNEASKHIWGGAIVPGSERWAQTKAFWHDSGKKVDPNSWASIRALSAGQTSLNELIDIETYDGQQKIIQNSAAPIRNAEGQIVQAVIVNEDVTERVRAEEALKKAEDNHRFVLDATPAMIHTARPDGYLDYFNQRWTDYVGVPMEKLQGWGWMTVIHPEDIEGEVSRWRECVASGEPFRYEVRMRRADGKYRWVLHHKVAVRDGQGNIVKWCGSSMDIDDQKQAERLLRDSYAQLRALSARLQSVREEEAIRIAREIHDDLGQKLTGLKMDLRRAERKIEGLGNSPAVNSLLDTVVSATELVDGTTASIQEIAANLRPEMLDKLGLGAALRYESRRFQERTGVLCEVILPETEPELSTGVSTALFRIFQECLTNIARHAHATNVKAVLELDGGWVILSVQDNGRGITEAEMADPESLGLLGMKERAALLGGAAVFQRAPGGGTVARVRVPEGGMSVQVKEHI
ncbi:MAG TPA: PAS domain S-box protein [Candidatus Acidoferrales bacterium]|jgi:PAS domain S-box-containing protein|nr:PAS domain S-box protein [Candidatus Acidoferrales bacterium]